MKIIKGRKYNDCLVCAMAMLLDMEYEAIPLFVEKKDYHKSKHRWLKKHGFLSALFEVNKTLLPIINFSSYYCIGHLLKKNAKIGHAVVLKYTNNKLSIYRDSDTTKSYALKDLTHIEIISKVL